jgi:hypothetical protein
MAPQQQNWMSARGVYDPTRIAALLDAQRQQPQQPQKSHRSLLASFLPTAGAIGAGLIAAPFTGGASLAAALATLGTAGALGSAGGEILAQKVSHQKTNWGDIAKQGALGGALSAGGELFSALNAARTSGAGLEGLKGALSSGEAYQGLKGITTPGTLENIATQAKTSVVNPKVGASVGGAQQESNIVNTLSDLGFKGSAKTQYTQLEPKMSQLSGKIGDITASTTETTPIKSIFNSISTKAENLPSFVGTDPKYQNALNSELTQLTNKFAGQQATASELYAAKQELNQKMGNIFTKIGKGADLGPKEAARLSVWQGVDSSLQELAPNAKALLTQQSTLYSAAPGLKASAQKTLGIPLLGVKSATANRAAQYGTDLAARGLQGVSGGAGLMGAISKQALPQIIPRAIGGEYNQAYQTVNQPGDMVGGTTGDMTGLSQGSQMGSMDVSGGQGMMVQQPQSAYSLEQALTDLQSTNNPKYQQQIMDRYNFVNKAESAMQKGSTGSAQQQKALYGVQNAMQTLDNIVNQFQQSGGGQGVAGNISNILAKANINPALKAYNQQKTDAALAIAVGLFGANAGRSPKIIQEIKDSLPNANDSRDAVTFKVNNLRQRIGAVYQDTINYGQPYGGGGLPYNQSATDLTGMYGG